MIALGAGVVPMYLTNSTGGGSPLPVAPQIRDFDVFYIFPPILGLQITGGSQ